MEDINKHTINQYLDKNGRPKRNAPLYVRKGYFLCKLTNKFPNIELQGEFTNSRELTSFICKDCETVFKKTPDGVICSSSGCPNNCNKTRSIAEVLVTELSIRNIRLIAPYINSRVKLELACNICSFKWEAYKGNIDAGGGLSFLCD